MFFVARIHFSPMGLYHIQRQSLLLSLDGKEATEEWV